MSSIHHCFFKSQYFKEDRNESWNTIILPDNKHRIIHHASPDEVIESRELNLTCKEWALEQYTGEHREELLRIYNQLKLKMIPKKKKKSTNIVRKFRDGEWVWSTYLNKKVRYSYERDKYNVALIKHNNQDK